MIEYGKMPQWLRWVGFIPALCVSAIIVYFVVNIGMDGLSRYIYSDIFYYIIQRIAFNLFGISFCLYSSVSMIPKGKIILSSIYLGIIIMLVSFSFTSYLFTNNGEYHLWQIIYESLLSSISGICILIYTIIWSKEQKEAKNKITYTYED